ncbi:MAG: chemotaxis response regulator protein-glutamate methylesterase [Planctomycetes bacterium]|nr:chemotaxis response regulator protein-glutamate methylesterase [Planctomycetota bacterium]
MKACKVLLSNIPPTVAEYLVMVLKYKDGFELIPNAAPLSHLETAVRDLHPDLVILGVETSAHEAKQAIGGIMSKTPTPVLLFSDISKTGPEPVIDALAEGAVDFVDRCSYSPENGILPNKEVFLEKIELARESRAGAAFSDSSSTRIRQSRPKFKKNIVTVAIGVSLGGPSALQRVLPRLPKEIGAAILIVQHMPPKFTGALADRLNQISAITVKEAREHDTIAPGLALLAPGGFHMEVSPSGLIHMVEPEAGARFIPSIDRTFLSLAKHFGRNCIGVILTGMGKDGVLGIRQIKEAGGRTIAQDEATSLIFGMPKAAIELGTIDRVLPLDAVADEIVAEVKKLEKSLR